jgi:hypothetical protein
MGRALQRCLDSGDTEVVGVLAQLATIQDRDLSALLAATLGTRLQVQDHRRQKPWHAMPGSCCIVAVWKTRARSLVARF